VSIITLDEARQALNYDPDDISDDAELQLYVDAITGVVEDYKAETIEPTFVTEELELPGLRKFYLSTGPVISLSAITALDAWSFVPDVSTLHVTKETGRVRVGPSGFPPRGFVAITYQAGYSPIPLRYKRGALVILQHVWETQRGTSLTATLGIVGPEERGATSTFSIPRKALEWLGPPRQVAG
jgi:hypothetical protein